MFIHATEIKDVPPSDPAYEAINFSIDQGFFTLFTNKTFQSQKPITRKDMAFILFRLNKIENKEKLAKHTIDALNQLSKEFKPLLQANHEKIDLLGSDFTLLKHENESLHDDLSRLFEKNIILEDKLNYQRWWIYALLALNIVGFASN